MTAKQEKHTEQEEQGRIPTNPTDGYEKGSPEGADSCKSENLQVSSNTPARKE